MKKVILATMILCAVMLDTNFATGKENMISEGKNVKFDYVLTVDGQVIDSSEGKIPLEYIQGQEMIIHGLESQLEGLKAGDKKTVVVGPEDAYGVVDQDAIIEIPTDRLGGGIDPKVGTMIQLAGPSGQPILGRIVEVKEATVVIDLNHPLAGKELHFDIEIVEVK